MKKVCLLLVLLGTVWGAVESARPQTASRLDIQLYPGVTITGAVGRVYAIEYTTGLEEDADWHVAGLLQLPTSHHLWFDRGAAVRGKRYYRAAEVQVEPLTNMVFLQPGSFAWGSPEDETDRSPDETPQTTVTIESGFWIGRYEVTQGEYEELTGANPSRFIGSPNRPVESVTWQEANSFCAALTTRERNLGRIAVGYEYRLPTEAEWEYACRAGTRTRFSHGDDPGYTNLAAYGWYLENNDPNEVKVVGQRKPNSWGLYDMHGNVQEWCADWYADRYPGGSVIDPPGPDAGEYRVNRGGTWISPGERCRSAARSWHDPSLRRDFNGFRVVLSAMRSGG